MHVAPCEAAKRSLLILAGGRATRLGGARKALLSVGGRPILGRILDALGPLAAERVALVHDADLPAFEGLRVEIDPRPHGGPVAALAHGLGVAAGDVCLVVAGDMPFVSRAAFAYLAQVRAAADAAVAVPYVDGYIESMHAVVSRRAMLAGLEAAEAAGERRIFRVLQALEPRLVDADELRRVDPELRTLFNVNSPEDLEHAQRIAAAERGH
jgi:molybdopterin-guanine dinucleotide biosynthesis protein A